MPVRLVERSATKPLNLPLINVVAHGRVLARGTAAKAYESGVMQRVVIVEFDSPEAARRFYCSGAYQAALPSRLNASTGNGFACLLTGVE